MSRYDSALPGGPLKAAAGRALKLYWAQYGLNIIWTPVSSLIPSLHQVYRELKLTHVLPALLRPTSARTCIHRHCHLDTLDLSSHVRGCQTGRALLVPIGALLRLAHVRILPQRGLLVGQFRTWIQEKWQEIVIGWQGCLLASWYETACITMKSA